MQVSKRKKHATLANQLSTFFDNLFSLLLFSHLNSNHQPKKLSAIFFILCVL